MSAKTMKDAYKYLEEIITKKRNLMTPEQMEDLIDKINVAISKVTLSKAYDCISEELNDSVWLGINACIEEIIADCVLEFIDVYKADKNEKESLEFSDLWGAKIELLQKIKAPYIMRRYSILLAQTLCGTSTKCGQETISFS